MSGPADTWRGVWHPKPRDEETGELQRHVQPKASEDSQARLLYALVRACWQLELLERGFHRRTSNLTNRSRTGQFSACSLSFISFHEGRSSRRRPWRVLMSNSTSCNVTILRGDTLWPDQKSKDIKRNRMISNEIEWIDVFRNALRWSTHIWASRSAGTYWECSSLCGTCSSSLCSSLVYLPIMSFVGSTWRPWFSGRWISSYPFSQVIMRREDWSSHRPGSPLITWRPGSSWISLWLASTGSLSFNPAMELKGWLASPSPSALRASCACFAWFASARWASCLCCSESRSLLREARSTFGSS